MEPDQCLTLKIYEIISHRKDKSSIIFSLEQFRIAFSIENKMKKTKELIRKIIRTAEREWGRKLMSILHAFQ